jgi:hypothetical protein
MNGNFNVSDGGLVHVVDGLTGEVKPYSTRRYVEPAYQRKDREMTARARDFCKDSRERELEKQLINQLAGFEMFKPTAVDPRLAFEFEEWTSSVLGNQDTIEKLNSELFNQVAAAYVPPPPKA